jgi:hypothetical protein
MIKDSLAKINCLSAMPWFAGGSGAEDDSTPSYTSLTCMDYNTNTDYFIYGGVSKD